MAIERTCLMASHEPSQTPPHRHTHTHAMQCNQYCNFSVTYCVCVLLKASHDGSRRPGAWRVRWTLVCMCFNCSLVSRRLSIMCHPAVATLSLMSQRLFVSIAASSLFYKQLLNCETEKICDNKHSERKTSTSTITNTNIVISMMRQPPVTSQHPAPNTSTLDCNHVNVLLLLLLLHKRQDKVPAQHENGKEKSMLAMVAVQAMKNFPLRTCMSMRVCDTTH